MASTTIDSHSSDGSARRYSATSWSDAETGNGNGYASALKARAHWDGGVFWWCQRGFLAFDITGLPIGWTVTAGSVNLKVEAFDSSSDEVLCTEWTETGTPAVDSSDFQNKGDVAFTNQDNASSVDTWLSLSLYSAGINYINAQTEDYAYFCIREYGHDYGSGTPASGSSYSIQFYDSGDVGNEPYLSLTYYITQTSIHNTQFTLYETGKSSHNTRFVITGKILTYNMNDGTGTNIDDSAGIRDGTLNDSSTWTTSGSNWYCDTGEWCLEFNGTDIQRIDTPSFDLREYSQNILTFSMWINTSDTYATLFADGNQSSTNGYFWAYIPSNSNDLTFQYCSDQARALIWSGALTNVQDRWAHIVFIADYTGGTIKLYVNKTLDSSKNIVNPPALFPDVDSAKYVGMYNPWHSWRFNGVINRFEIFNYALSQAEINALYSEGRSTLFQIESHNSQFEICYFGGSFHNTRFAIAPPETAVESHLGDSSIYKEGTVWDTIHDAANGDGVSTDIRVQIKELTGNYTIQRSFLAFNTDFLKNPTIISARLVLRTTSETPSNNPVLIIKEWEAADTIVDIADYSEIGSQVSYPTTVSAANTDYVWYFNATGVASININGYSYYMVRERDHDDADVAPDSSTSYETVFYDSESAYEPTLYISYYENPASSHNTRFVIFSPTLSTHNTQFVMAVGAEITHNTQFILTEVGTSTHNTQFTIESTTKVSIQHTQFTIWMRSSHNTQFEITSVMKTVSHNTQFSLLPDKDDTQRENLEYYINLQRNYYPKWIRPVEGNILDIINTAIVEETYKLIGFIQHIIELLDPTNALIAANDGSGLTKNTQLDYLLGIINRERWKDETDSELRTRIIEYVSNFLGGGKLDQYQETLTYRYTTIPEYAIKMDEPMNPYYDTDETFFFEKFENTCPYLERPPDHFGYVHEDTIRVYLSGAPPPNGEGIWKIYKIADAQDIATFQIDILDTYKSNVEEEEGAITALDDDKCTTPFAGFKDYSDSQLSRGIFYVDSGGTEYTIHNLADIENPYFFHKEEFGDPPVEAPESFIDIVTPTTINHTSITIFDCKESNHNTSFKVVDFGMSEHNTQFIIQETVISSHNTQFEIQETSGVSSHNTRFIIYETAVYYVHSADAYIYSVDTDWATLRAKTSGTVDSLQMKILTSELSSYYTIGRGFLAFLTPMGGTKTILSAIVSVRTNATAPIGSPNMMIQKWDEGGTYIPNAGSFNDGHTNLCSSKTISGTNTWYHFTFNATGRSWINKTGYSTFCLKEYDHDVSNNPPASSTTFQATFYDSISSSYKPYITIQYY